MPFASLRSMANCIHPSGFIVVGACESEMLKFNVLEDMKTLSEAYGVNPVAIQKIDCKTNNSDEDVDGKYVLITMLKK